MVMSVGAPLLPGFTIGCDPELFILNDKGLAVCADGLIPGTKAEPYKVTDGAVQVDGMAAEINTNPAKTFGEFHYNLTSVLNDLKKMLPKGYTLINSPTVSFTKDEWDRAPDHAKQLGCTPDFDAWTGEVNMPPERAPDSRLATGAGHLHFGWTDDADMADTQYIATARDFVKQLDWYLGAWSLLEDTDSTRRTLYGKAGAMRFKPYGVEYRPLSNFWVMSPDLRLQVWNRAAAAMRGMSTNFLPKKTEGSGFDKKLIQSINTSTRSRALETVFKFPIMTIYEKVK